MGRFAKRQLYAAINKKFKAQMEAMRAEAKRVRQEVYEQYPTQTWVQWLQEQGKAGRAEAIEALRKRAFSLAAKHQNTLRGEKPAAPGIIPGEKVEGVTKHGTVIYDLGADAVRDDSERFTIGNGATRETDIMALKLAQRRFGNLIFVEGDYAFKERMVRAAVEGKVYVKFADPVLERKRNELFRSQYRERKESEGGGRQQPQNGRGNGAPGAKKHEMPSPEQRDGKHQDHGKHGQER